MTISTITPSGVVIYPPCTGRTLHLILVRCPSGCGDHVHRARELPPEGLARSAPCGTDYRIAAPVPQAGAAA